MVLQSIIGNEKANSNCRTTITRGSMSQITLGTDIQPAILALSLMRIYRGEFIEELVLYHFSNVLPWIHWMMESTKNIKIKCTRTKAFSNKYSSLIFSELKSFWNNTVLSKQYK